MNKVSNTALFFGILIAGIIVGVGSAVLSAGFVSYENGDTFIFWDNVRVGPIRADGSDSIYCVDGIGDNEQDCLNTGGEWRPYSGVIVGKGESVPQTLAQPGNIIVEGKNIYVMGAIAQCDEYQEGTLVDQVNCSTIIRSAQTAGVQTTLIYAGQIRSDEELELLSDANIILGGPGGVSIQGKLVIDGDGTLVVGNPSTVDDADIYAEIIETDRITSQVPGGILRIGGPEGVTVNGFFLLGENNNRIILPSQ